MCAAPFPIPTLSSISSIVGSARNIHYAGFIASRIVHGGIGGFGGGGRGGEVGMGGVRQICSN